MNVSCHKTLHRKACRSRAEHIQRAVYNGWKCVTLSRSLFILMWFLFCFSAHPVKSQDSHSAPAVLSIINAFEVCFARTIRNSECTSTSEPRWIIPDCSKSLLHISKRDRHLAPTPNVLHMCLLIRLEVQPAFECYSKYHPRVMIQAPLRFLLPLYPSCREKAECQDFFFFFPTLFSLSTSLQGLSESTVYENSALSSNSVPFSFLWES